MEEFVREGDIAIWTDSEGAGQPVLLIPGGPGCCDYLEPVARLLGDGIRTIRFDPAGCGRSGTRAAYHLHDTIADLEVMRRHFGLERWIVLGHSAGADHALAYALQHPDRVDALICLSGGRIHNDRDWHAAYSEGRDAGREAPLGYAYPYNPEVNLQLNAEWKRYIKRPGLLAEIARLRTPALFVYGTDDIRPSWPAEQVAGLLPRGRMRLLPGAGHNLWVTHAKSLAQLMNGFITKVGADQ